MWYAGRYRSEPGIAPDSKTETMVAVKAEVDNWRWHGGAVFPAFGHCQHPRILGSAGGDPLGHFFPAFSSCWSFTS